MGYESKDKVEQKERSGIRGREVGREREGERENNASHACFCICTDVRFSLHAFI